jgi:protein-S-isoprenylcysteine O-methyltransferase Ste14
MSTSHVVRDRLFRALVGVGLWASLLFGAAGRIDWLRGWVYIAIYVTSLVVGEIVVARKNPELLRERSKRQKGTKAFDRVILPMVMVTFLVLPVVVGLDAVRFGWTHVGWWALGAGLPLYLAGQVLVTWSMAINPHLEKTVRIQADRGHQVITRGPYALVRHPMYLGVILQSFGAPLMLGSLWAYGPVTATVALFTIRTVLEDRMLRDDLPGYASFAASTRFRLVPGLW